MKRRQKGIHSVAWVAGLVFVVFLVGSLLFVFSTWRRNEAQIGEYLQEATSQRRLTVEQQIQGDFQVLRGVAVSLGEMDLQDRAHVNEILDIINRSNDFVRMGLMDTSGRGDLVDLSGTIHADVDLSRLTVFQQALAGGEAVSGTIPDPVTGQYVNYYAVPVTRDGQLVGVLCAVNAQEVMQHIMQGAVFQGVGYYTIVDADGRMLVPNSDPNPNVYVGASVFDVVSSAPDMQQRIAEALQSGAGGDFAVDIGGEEHLTVIQPLDINGWSIVSVVPHNVLNRYYNQTAIGTAFIIAAACLVFLFLLIRQVRQTAKNQKDLERLAYYDPLTGLRNYTKLMIDAQHILAQNSGRRFAVWSFDVKKFNTINDIFGIETGDHILQRIADHFRADEDDCTIACRIAADQFAGIRPYRDKQELVDWFWAVYGSLSEREILTDNEMNIDDAMGIYCIDDFDERVAVEEMVNRASIAKKAAKESAGTDVVFFTAEMGHRLHWETELLAGGQKALEEGEIVFFLQPKVDIQNDFRILGAEALARWHHPKHGFIPPSEFIPLFESNEFIVELDRYIFESVCKWLARCLPCKPAGLRLAVNVSRQGLLREDFVSYYSAVKQRYNIPDDILELEFTESVVFDDYARFQQTVLSLQQAGFTCSIDDFGSGFSSLNVLKNLPIDVLKLDAVFFRDSEDTARERIVIADFLQMARKLSIKTVAEGVETREQVLFLQRAGCNVVQGYIFSKPLPVEAFEALMRQGGGRIELPDASA